MEYLPMILMMQLIVIRTRNNLMTKGMSMYMSNPLMSYIYLDRKLQY